VCPTSNGEISSDAPGLRHGFAAKWHRRPGSFDGEIRDIRLNMAV